MLKLKLLDFNTTDNEYLLDDDDDELQRRLSILDQDSDNVSCYNIKKCYTYTINIFGIDDRGEIN